MIYSSRFFKYVDVIKEFINILSVRDIIMKDSANIFNVYS